MVPALETPRWPRVSGHMTIGCSTGFMSEDRGDWPALARKAAGQSTYAVEFAALAEPELAGLLEYLGSSPSLPFLYISVHAPTKGRQLSEGALVNCLSEIVDRVDAIVTHPDVIADAALYESLGRKLVIENNDRRKLGGQTADDLGVLFEQLPGAGLCLDLAHAKSVNPTMDEAAAMLDRFGMRLRHLHLSSLDDDCHHVSLTAEDAHLFAPSLERCRDVPWILEAPLPSL